MLNTAMTISEVHAADQRWDTNKIKTLIDGEATVTITDATGRQYDELREGRSAFDLRCSAFDRGRIEDIFEPMQLDIAIKEIAKDQPTVAAALHLATRGFTEAEIEEVMGTNNVRRYLDRGIELVRRHEGGRAAERRLNRVGSATCWRCMCRPAKPGELCEEGCDGKTDAQRRQLAGLRRGQTNQPYDPTIVADPCMMTEAEIEAEIAHLAATQGVSDTDARGVDRRKRDAPIAGGTEYTKQVVPYGTSPDEIEGVDWSPLP